MKYIREYEALKIYDNLLDEIYGEVKIAGLTYFTSDVLKHVDFVAYRTGFLDWLDSEGLTIDEDEADEEA